MILMVKIKNIHDDIYLIGGSGLSGPGDCMIYLIASDEGLIMIDSGVDKNSVDRLVQNIRGLNFDPQDLTALILTHCHIDHTGGASTIQKLFDVKIIAHKIEAQVIEGKEHSERIGAYFYGVDYEPCSVDLKIKDDYEELNYGNKQLKILFTPGHTPGGISPYIDVEEKRVLFGQDIHGPLMKGFGSNRRNFLNSLQKLLELDADILCEGHFGIYEPHEKVEKYIRKYIKQYSK
ncbi:MAG: MBL fold metallo-hydrolase [Candidatus Lokiarchaeota archaeon]|nr:MBL fold metallo-hydrolase [Candidatus Lokiarchaeota archaeon]